MHTMRQTQLILVLLMALLWFHELRYAARSTADLIATARAKIRQGDGVAALADLSRAIELNPGNAEAFRLRAGGGNPTISLDSQLSTRSRPAR